MEVVRAGLLQVHRTRNGLEEGRGRQTNNRHFVFNAFLNVKDCSLATSAGGVQEMEAEHGLGVQAVAVRGETELL